jgi:hypothetical protein
MMKWLSVAWLLLTTLSCRGTDRTITHGADSEGDWSRRLAAAVPIGTPKDSARRLMEANGFQCREGTDSVPYLWCSKSSASANIVTRKWSAVLNLDSNRVRAVRGLTGLVGP